MQLITGNKFRKKCNFSLDQIEFTTIREPKEGEIIKFFVRVDLIHQFFKHKQTKPYILVTHNGDTPISDEFLIYMNDTNLIRWYSQNVKTYHPKLKSIPIGIANEIWPHGDELVFNNVIQSNHEKSQLVYANFDVATNIIERSHCLNILQSNNITKRECIPFNLYLEELSKSYFVVSPDGNGIDCHKTWEALYVKTIPIVTRSINIEHYKDLPIIILNDWSEFNVLDYNISLYEKLWADFNRESLTIDNFLYE